MENVPGLRQVSNYGQLEVLGSLKIVNPAVRHLRLGGDRVEAWADGGVGWSAAKLDGETLQSDGFEADDHERTEEVVHLHFHHQ